MFLGNEVNLESATRSFSERNILQERSIKDVLKDECDNINQISEGGKIEQT